MLGLSGVSGRLASPGRDAGLVAGRGRAFRLALAGVALLGLAACDENSRLPSNSRHYVPISPQLEALMSDKGMNARQPILFRAYKKESELEVWKQDASGEYKLLKTYPMCRWSGQLGPKKTEGDRMVPEGFYSITPAQLNPNSSFYLSFNVGYPNAYDRSFGRTGSNIMVHGACSSRGCFSMTDEQIADIYALTREAFGGGQKAVQLQSFPFRFTPENLARYRADENMPFWRNLKEGNDHFEVSRREPQVSVCARRYVFNAQAKDGGRFEAASACPPLQQDSSLMAAVSEKNRADEQKMVSLVNAGTRAVKRIYQDGDQHHSFKNTIYAQSEAGEGARLAANASQSSSRVAEVSRPDALDHGPIDVPAEQARGLNHGQLLAKAAQARTAEPAAAVASTPARPAAPANAATATRSVAGAPVTTAAPAPSASAFAAAPAAAKEQPAFYQRWLGSLGNLTATTAGEEQMQAVTAPLPPKAPAQRR